MNLRQELKVTLKDILPTGQAVVLAFVVAVLASVFHLRNGVFSMRKLNLAVILMSAVSVAMAEAPTPLDSPTPTVLFSASTVLTKTMEERRLDVGAAEKAHADGDTPVTITHVNRLKCNTGAAEAATIARSAYQQWVMKPSGEKASQIVARWGHEQRQYPRSDPFLSSEELFALVQVGIDEIGSAFTTAPAQPEQWEKAGDMRPRVMMILVGWCERAAM